MQQVSYHKDPAYTPPKDGGPSADGPGPLVRQPAVTLEAYGPIEHYWDIEKPCKPDALSSWKGIKKFLSKRLHRAPCPQSSDSALQRATHKALAATRAHAPQAHEAWKALLDTMHPTPAQTKHLMNSVVEGRRTMIEEVVAQGDTETLILLSKRLPAAFYGQGRVVVGRGDWIAQSVTTRCKDAASCAAYV